MDNQVVGVVVVAGGARRCRWSVRSLVSSSGGCVAEQVVGKHELKCEVVVVLVAMHHTGDRQESFRKRVPEQKTG